MARPLRIEYPGAWYHVMNRGAGRKNVYHIDRHRELFLELLDEIHKRYRVEIHSYCLMGNHYHLLLRTPLPNLSRAMKHLDGVYTQRYNQLCGVDGPLFRGRFKSIVVDAQQYLPQLSRYIHLNPVVAGIVQDAKQYRWSSYRSYLYSRLRPHWLCCDEVLGKMGERMQQQRYRLFISEGIDAEIHTFYKQIKKIPVLGSEVFRTTISEKYLQDKPIDPEVPQHRKLHGDIYLPSVTDVVNQVAEYYQVDPTMLKKARRGSVNRPRLVATYLARQATQATLAKIASEFENLSYSGASSICRRVEHMMAADNDFRQEVNALLEVLNWRSHNTCSPKPASSS